MMVHTDKPTDLRTIDVPIYTDKRGSLLAVENSPECIPFDPVRIFYLLDVPPGSQRACHAASCELFILALAGEARLTNIHRQAGAREWLLNSRTSGLYIPAYRYIELSDFGEDTVIAVCASKSMQHTRHYSLKEMQERWQAP